MSLDFELKGLVTGVGLESATKKKSWNRWNCWVD